jgi:hypothetical protein
MLFVHTLNVCVRRVQPVRRGRRRRPWPSRRPTWPSRRKRPPYSRLIVYKRR